MIPPDNPKIIEAVLATLLDGVEKTKLDIIKDAKREYRDEAGWPYGLKELKECVDLLQARRIIVFSSQDVSFPADGKSYLKSTITT